MDCTVESKKQVAYESGDKYSDVMLTGKAYFNSSRKKIVEFICCCGKTNCGRLDSIKSYKIKSCGCRKNKIGTVGVSQRKIPKHGLCNHTLYKTWDGMKQRCTNPKTKYFKNYGGRGITICEEWINNPEVFISWAIENGWEEGLTIERKENDKGYSPTNCKFASTHEQSRNKRSNVFILAFGENKCVADWVKDERCVVSKNEINYRIDKMGWQPELAITTLSVPNKRDSKGQYISMSDN